ncbi:-Vacuolar protein sorting-associated protein 11 homolog [Babesia bigemina]|uniref:-Vacuolar protein sorting-associated protein 11 homolog n=1 Tax=Babesia bigemina TaxID=5866 RepID=A0A061DAZ3_BABBI|nr:-Vacuolar protein sorting-associated protein 11 homolog [Babesia bigemina]CDR97718.1 -Vacuolar protein sorting-associated protein 11 homolog [Babesia bigemina]|eukprot:XP_012769904.1 -Vacuolar protein sorting-associated protein 11 homolog [Babesia bigemina]
MAASRRFHFFDKCFIAVSEAGRGSVGFEAVVDTAGDDAVLWVLESSGRLNALYRDVGAAYSEDSLRCVSVKAFEFEAQRVFSCSEASAVVVVGKDEESDSMLKFNTYKVTPQFDLENNELLHFVQSVPVFSPSQGLVLDHVQAVAVSPCASVVAVATAGGCVYVYRNYVIPPVDGSPHDHRLRSYSVGDLAGAHHLGTIRALHVSPLSSGVFGLAVCCDSMIVSLRLAPDPEIAYTQLIESSFESSCNLGSKGQFVVAKSGGMLDIYDIESGFVNAVKGSESCASICAYKHYVATASLECRGGLEASYATTLVNVQSIVPGVDFVAHSQYIPVVFKFERALRSLYVFARSGTSSALILFELREKGIHDRLQILIRKRMFEWALRIAALERRPLSECEELHKIHANWLYDKGHYDLAIEAYCRAGSAVEPAFVIGRFMSLRARFYLYKYLLHLHRSGSVSRIHTVVLMRALQSLFEDRVNGGCRLDAATPADSVGATGASEPDSNEVDCQQLLSAFLSEFGDSHQDGIMAALSDCRSSGGSDFARVVALAQQNHDQYVDILVEDFHDYSSALDYLMTVDRQVACNAILRHGRRLVKHNSDAVLSLIRKIGESMPHSNGNVHDAFVPIFCMEDRFLSEMLGSDGPCTQLLIFATRLHLMLDQFASHRRRVMDDTSAAASSAPTNGQSTQQHPTTPPPPSDGTQAHKASALDECVGSAGPLAVAEAPSAAHADGEFDITGLENRMWKLLNGNTQHAEYQMIALILCLLYSYQRGANLMAIKMGYYHLPLVLAGMGNNEINSNKFDLLNHALSYGYNEPTLWIGALSLLVGASNDTSEEIRGTLRHIQTHRLLSFPGVLAILKKKQTLQFGHVKEYLRNEFRRIEELLQECIGDIAQDKIDCGQMNRDLQRLQHSYFVINNTNCSRCELCLEMPSLHFYCQHSFHTYCIGTDGVCPKCAPATQDGPDGGRPQKGSGHQDDFFKFLSGATDPFVYMAQQLERFAFARS